MWRNWKMNKNKTRKSNDANSHVVDTKSEWDFPFAQHLWQFTNKRNTRADVITKIVNVICQFWVCVFFSSLLHNRIALIDEYQIVFSWAAYYELCSYLVWKLCECRIKMWNVSIAVSLLFLCSFSHWMSMPFFDAKIGYRRANCVSARPLKRWFLQAKQIFHPQTFKR